MEYERIVQKLGPLYDSKSKVLILGTIPSPKSREAKFFYGHPQNRFWKVLCAILGEPFTTDTEQKRKMCLKHGVAIWDVLHACDIVGASDAKIKNPEPNDLSPVFEGAQIKAVFTTGATAYNLYQKLCAESTGKDAIKLPSTSPANAAWSFERLKEAYSEILKYL